MTVPTTGSWSNRPASTHTARSNDQAVHALPFDRDDDQVLARRGLIAQLDPPEVRSSSGELVWSVDQYRFLDEQTRPDSVHPSLWRTARLNTLHGLFEVTTDVYQVRGYDISNMTVVVGDEGFVVIDPMTTVETASASMGLITEHLGSRPVTAVVLTHSHLDHYGGIEGVLDSDVEVPIIAPAGFLDAVATESLMAGHAMARRSRFMYGPHLARGPRGQVTAALGMTAPRGTSSLVPPTVEIGETGASLLVDGVRMVFQYTPESEAPAALTLHLPDHRTLCMADLATHGMHNLYTLRGAQVRDAVLWSDYLLEAADGFATESDVMVLGHNWPVWEPAEIDSFLRMQAATYKFIHDQTLRLANQGFTKEEVAAVLRLPEDLEQSWSNRGLYGSLSHNAKAVHQRYFGWFDGNPANLDPLPPDRLGRRWVESLGGEDSVLALARRAHADGDYRWAAELMTHLLAASPEHQDGRELQAEIFEQLGYQTECATWRNFYLSGSEELRSPDGVGEVGSTGRFGLRSALEPRLMLDYLAVRLDGLASANVHADVHWHVDGERHRVVVRYGVLTHRPARTSDTPQAVLTCSSDVLADVSAGRTDVDDAIASGALATTGDLTELRAAFAHFQHLGGPFSLTTPGVRAGRSRPSGP